MMGGWEEKKLGNVATISYGYTAKARQDEVGPRFLRITDIKTYGVKWDSVPFCTISKKDHEKYRLKSGDIVFARTGATTGKSHLVQYPPDSVCASYLIRLSLNDETVLPEYLISFFQTKQYWNVIEKGMSGSAQGGFNASKLSKLSVPVPPLNLQKSIVAILDEAFAGINKAIANSEKNFANARELFESHLNSVLVQTGDEWVEKKLGEFCESISTGPFGALLHKSDYVNNGVPLVNPINIVGDTIIANPSKLIDSATKERLNNYVLSEGDIVIGRRGEIGRCAVIGNKEDGWVCGTGCFFIRPFKNVKPEFLANLLRSRIYRERLERVATGATMKNLSNKSLSNLHISIPATETQIDILNHLSDLNRQTQRLETIYQKKLDALAELKQAILQKAFTGELTAGADYKQVVNG